MQQQHATIDIAVTAKQQAAQTAEQQSTQSHVSCDAPALVYKAETVGHCTCADWLPVKKGSANFLRRRTLHPIARAMLTLNECRRRALRTNALSALQKSSQSGLSKLHNICLFTLRILALVAMNQ